VVRAKRGGAELGRRASRTPAVPAIEKLLSANQHAVMPKSLLRKPALPRIARSKL